MPENEEDIFYFVTEQAVAQRTLCVTVFLFDTHKCTRTPMQEYIKEKRTKTNEKCRSIHNSHSTMADYLFVSAGS